MKIFTGLLILLGASVVSNAQQPLKRLYLGNDTHTDLMWNGTEEEWYRYSLDMARFYLKIGESSGVNAPEERSKWNYDAAWALYMMERREPPEFFNRLINQIKLGQASVPFNFTLPVYGASTLESILRSFYYGGYLERKYSIDIDLAICQENATIPLGLASLWAGSGARYSWRGVCNCATKMATNTRRDQEIYWYTGLDGSRILMKWYSNYGWNAELGGYAEMLEPGIAVIQLDTLCGTPHYPYNIAAAFGKGWDNIHNYSLDILWGVKHRTRPGTRVILSDEVDFFRDFEENYGSVLPSLSVTYGNEWDLNIASLAEVSGKLRRSMEKLRTAEALAAIATSGNNDKLKQYDGLKEAFYYGLGMYSLHGWTADGPIDKHYFAGYMRTNQEKVSLYVDSLCAFGLRELGRRISGGDNVFFVFNPLGQARSGLISIPVTEGSNAVRDLETGKTRTGSVYLVNGKSYLKVHIDDVPPAGYKLIKLVNNGIKGQHESFNFSGRILETPFYRVTFTGSGAIVSLIDKKTGWEYSRGMLNSLDSASQDQRGEITISEKDSYQITLRITGTLPVRHESRMTFYSEDRRIDIENSINQNFDAPLHWSFNFNIPDPEVWHEETGAIIKAKLASSGGHYADRMARYDYLTLNHFLNVGNSSKNITLSNADCMFFKLGKSTVNVLDQASSDIHVLIGGQVNGDLGVAKQDGDSVFFQHFSILPGDGPFEMAGAMNFALDHQNPLIAGKAGKSGDLKQKSYSFVKTSDPGIILWTLKNGEEGGIVLRTWNLGSGPSKTVFGFAGPLEKAWNISHVETIQSELTVNDRTLTVPIRKQQLISLRVRPR